MGGGGCCQPFGPFTVPAFIQDSTGLYLFAWPAYLLTSFLSLRCCAISNVLSISILDVVIFNAFGKLKLRWGHSWMRFGHEDGELRRCDVAHEQIPM